MDCTILTDRLYIFRPSFLSPLRTIHGRSNNVFLLRPPTHLLIQLDSILAHNNLVGNTTTVVVFCHCLLLQKSLMMATDYDSCFLLRVYKLVADVFLKNGPSSDSFPFIFVFSNKLYNFNNNKCEKMSIQ